MHLEKGEARCNEMICEEFHKSSTEEELNELKFMPNTRTPGRKIKCNYVFLYFLFSLSKSFNSVFQKRAGSQTQSSCLPQYWAERREVTKRIKR